MQRNAEASETTDRAARQALVEELWHHGIERGESLVSFTSQVAGGLDRKAVLDLGCATGGITQVLAGHAGLAVGLDSRRANVTAAAARAKALDGPRPCFASGDALQLPFPGERFHVVLMSGLLEWLGFALPQHPPRMAQLRGLREVHRVLAPGGHLLVGIENRWFPKFLIRSPHQGLALALLLPSRVAWWLPRWVFGAKVHECLHGRRGLRALLREAGFENVSLYLPVFGYQFPRAVVPDGDRRALLDAVAGAEGIPTSRLEQVATGARWGRAWFRLIARLGVQAYLAPAFMAVARKGTGGQPGISEE